MEDSWNWAKFITRIKPYCAQFLMNLRLVAGGILKRKASFYLNSLFQTYGVTTDNKIPYWCHMKNVLSKVSKCAGLLYRLQKCLTLETHLSFVFSFINPHLRYNISVWGRTNKYILKAFIFFFQKKKNHQKYWPSYLSWTH